MTQTITDVVQDDGSVTRTTSTTLPNGDTDVRTHTYQAAEYQALQTQIATQIANLQAQLTTLQAQQTTITTNVATINTNLSKKTTTIK
jgi:septal ring factor EnvC (AmiA/AmiB activator)